MKLMGNLDHSAQKIAYTLSLIFALFFSLSCIVTLILSLSFPTVTAEFVKQHFIFSRFGVVGGFLIHIIGNLLFAAVGIFIALFSWKGLNSQPNPSFELITTRSICKKCGKVHKLYVKLETTDVKIRGSKKKVYYKSFQDPKLDKYCVEKGYLPLPVNNKIKCDCGTEIDLSDLIPHPIIS